MYYDYEYFCGANVYLELNGAPILEAAAISYAVSDSKRPIYGYSSHLFDAVADGQVIVQGSLIINYVRPNYLLAAIQQGDIDKEPALFDTKVDTERTEKMIEMLTRGDSDARLFLPTSISGVDHGVSATDALTMINNATGTSLAKALEDKYWGNVSPTSNVTSSDILRIGPVDIRIVFAEKQEELIVSAFFTSFGKQIQISQDVILEEYSFFARYLSR